MPKKRRITKLSVQYVSLVPRGANQMPVVYKSEDRTAEVSTLSKFDEEQGLLTAVVYAPEIRDAQGDIASAEVIKEAAHEFIRNGGKIDVRHDFTALGRDQVTVAETFIVQKGDERFAGWKDYSEKAVDLTGAWAMVLKIDDEDLRKQYRDGKWNGVSLAGPAVLEEEKTAIDELLGALAKALEDRTAQPHQDEIDMNKEELEALLKERDTRLSSEIVAAVKELLPQPKAADDDKDEDVTKSPDKPKNAAEARALAKQIQREALEAGVDWTDPESVEEFAAKLEELDAEEPVAKTKPARKTSVAKDTDDDEEGTLPREMQDLWKEGELIAKSLNPVTTEA